MLEIKKLSFRYDNKKILEDIHFSVQKGEMIGILGPNGSGKTTLMKLISGILPVHNGEIFLKDKRIESYSPKGLANVIAVLSQQAQESFAYQVKDIVALGRYAHQKAFFQHWRNEDEVITQRVMKQTGISSFQEISINQLSGGEKQRVYLAQALAQEPEILLLDEPTNHLDLAYQKELLDQLKKWSTENALTVICVFHDLNLASLYCDRLLLLNQGRIVMDAAPSKVLQENQINTVYQTKVRKTSHPSVSAPQIALIPSLEKRENRQILNDQLLHVKKEHIALCSPIPLRTLSSGVVGAGMGWHQSFVNRHVDKSYQCDNYVQEMKEYLIKHDFVPSETVGMMTAVYTEDVAYRTYVEADFSVLVVVTAGVGNAVDAAKAKQHSSHLFPGTINIWIFVNGKLSEQAYVQAVMTATEAKGATLRNREVRDKLTGTIATGTSTDSIVIAATQMGTELEFAGTITVLGKCIANGIRECLEEALDKSARRVLG